MFELELHDVIPYLLSISLLYTLAYAYATYVQDGHLDLWERSPVSEVLFASLPLTLVRAVPIRHWLARRVKRKESPDDDAADCRSSFVDDISNKRGGSRCVGTMYSLL
ncbi:hypothetical protein [Paenibacillus arenilitoris]|uniref:Uncharacterized protein n=1 Tax=Paenibacillus arenilitoris TaxID=2772299 RepID=A0A927CIQ0_9BACL|nr:hypothetical protein [Paenibacillus arenilitoris]MBD2868200.1 hypothetical protein [Paenibacillus arenilitoris]